KAGSRRGAGTGLLRELVADLPDEIAARPRLSVVLHAERPRSVHHSQDGSLVPVARDHGLYRVRGGAVDRHDLDTGANVAEEIDRERRLEKDQEGVPTRYLPKLVLRRDRKLVVVPLAPDQPRARRFRKGDAEARARDRVDHRLGEILGGLDEVRVAQDQVRVLG